MTSSYVVVYDSYLISSSNPVPPLQVVKDISLALNIDLKAARQIYATSEDGGELFSELTPEQLAQLRLKYTVTGHRKYEKYTPYEELPEVIAARNWWATLTEEQKEYAAIMTLPICC